MIKAWALIALEFRTVSGGKGSDTANQQRKDELAMQKQAFATQQQQIADLKAAFSKYTTGNIGFDPATLAAMKAAGLNTVSSTFNQAGQQVREALGARGNTGGQPVGGDYAKGIAELLGGRAQAQSQTLTGIDIQNALLANTNKFNAGNLLSGNAATLTGTQGVAGAGASSALNSYITAANQGFGNAFTTGLGGALGKGLGTAALGGVGMAIPTANPF